MVSIRESDSVSKGKESTQHVYSYVSDGLDKGGYESMSGGQNSNNGSSLALKCGDSNNRV